KKMEEFKRAKAEEKLLVVQIAQKRTELQALEERLKALSMKSAGLLGKPEAGLPAAAASGPANAFPAKPKASSSAPAVAPNPMFGTTFQPGAKSGTYSSSDRPSKPDDKKAAELEQKLDRLLKEVEQLRLDLKKSSG